MKNCLTTGLKSRFFANKIFGGEMADNNLIERKKKFSLIELLMIIMVVGIIFTLIIPLQSDKAIRIKLDEAIKNLQIIARADVAWSDVNGYFIFDHTVVKYNVASKDDFGDLVPAFESGEDLLNIRDQLIKKTDFFYFDYSVTDTTVVAVTNRHFGKKGAMVYYYLPSGPWGIGEDNNSKSMIDPNWLP